MCRKQFSTIKYFSQTTFIINKYIIYFGILAHVFFCFVDLGFWGFGVNRFRGCFRLVVLFTSQGLTHDLELLKLDRASWRDILLFLSIILLSKSLLRHATRTVILFSLLNLRDYLRKQLDLLLLGHLALRSENFSIFPCLLFCSRL